MYLWYSDIDECSGTTPVCHEHAQCDNLPGSYRCICKDRYYGDGTDCRGMLLLADRSYLLQYTCTYKRATCVYLLLSHAITKGRDPRPIYSVNPNHSINSPPWERARKRDTTHRDDPTRMASPLARRRWPDRRPFHSRGADSRIGLSGARPQTLVLCNITTYAIELQGTQFVPRPHPSA